MDNDSGFYCVDLPTALPPSSFLEHNVPLPPFLPSLARAARQPTGPPVSPASSRSAGRTEGPDGRTELRRAAELVQRVVIVVTSAWRCGNAALVVEGLSRPSARPPVRPVPLFNIHRLL